jgi:hypothetical protein
MRPCSRRNQAPPRSCRRSRRNTQADWPALTLADAKAVPYKWSGVDPGPTPSGITPATVSSEELPYIGQLVDAFSEGAGVTFTSHEDIASHPDHARHLSRQRERFFDADAFARFFRDDTMAQETAQLKAEMLDGVVEECEGDHPSQLARVKAVLSQAASVQPNGLLGRQARTGVKQGFCHHLVNEGALKWKKRTWVETHPMRRSSTGRSRQASGRSLS